MSILVNGAAELKSGTGSSGALESLGWTVDGVRLILREHMDGVLTDKAGTRIPWDEQYMGIDGIIRVQLVDYTESVLSKIRVKTSGGTDDSTALAVGTIGTLLDGAGLYFRLLVTSPVASLPWNFLKCRLLDAYEANLGTRRTAWNIDFYTYAPRGATNLYTRVTT